MLDGLEAGGIIADEAYDSNAVRALIADAGAKPSSLPSASGTVLIPHDAMAYKLRNRIERFFNKLKHFRRIATRYDRRAVHFLARPPSRQRHDMDALNVDSA